MATKKLNINSEKEDSLLENKVIDNTTTFIKQNYKPILIIFVLVIFCLAYIFGLKPIYNKKNLSAHKEMYRAIYDFEDKQYDKALNGDQNHLGFLQIIHKYDNTKAKQLAHFYAGTIYMHKKEFINAIKHLKQFKMNDYVIKSRAISLMGDALSELGRYKEAAQKYIKAAKNKPNDVYSPKLLLKAAYAFDEINANKSAIKCYQEIIKLYPNSTQAVEAKKLIFTLNPDYK